MNTVYQITSPSGSIYIGKTVNFRNRMYSYQSLHCKKQPKLYNSLAKHGFKAHVVEIIWQGDCNELELGIIEMFWIQVKDSIATGMNLTKGGEGAAGYKMSNEQRQKISELMKNRKWTDNQRQLAKARMKADNPMKSEDSRKKLSESRKGIKFSEEHKRKLLSNLNTLEARQKAANSKKGKRIGGDNHNSRKVYQKNGEVVVAEYDSAASASRATGIQRVNITKCCTGNRRIAGGFNWSYNE